MSHQVHPKGFRIKNIEDWESRGFYGKKPVKELEQDFRVREFLKKRIESENIEVIEIERFSNEVKIIIRTSRPGLIIGRRGDRVSRLKEELVKKVPELKNVKIEVKAVKNVWTSARLTAEWMARQIEKRMSYRRVLKQALGKIMRNKEVKGARVQLAGRLNGNEMSRTEWMKEGKLKRQTLRSNLDYAFTQAYCTYGVIGIKVWIYKGEEL